jgi:tetratricopeptide (TPR) repeat protein
MLKSFGIVAFICAFIFSAPCFCQSASEFVQAGFKDYQGGDYKSAIEKFTKALETPSSEISRETIESSKKTYTDEQEMSDVDVSKRTYTQTSKRTYTNSTEKEYVDTEMKSYVSKPLEYQGDEPAKIYLYRGWTYFQMGNKEAALNDFDKAVNLDPNLSDVYFRRAILSYDIDPEKACPNLLKAIERGHKSAQELFDLICNKE